MLSIFLTYTALIQPHQQKRNAPRPGAEQGASRRRQPHQHALRYGDGSNIDYLSPFYTPFYTLNSDYLFCLLLMNTAKQDLTQIILS